jgi:hypothetical protein
MKSKAVRALMLAVVIVVAACSGAASKGTMPPPSGPHGVVDPSGVPDFVAVAGRDDGIAGYVAKEAILQASDQTWPVYADDLRTVVGQLVPGKGFVPAGVDPATVPDVQVSVAPSIASPAQPNQKLVVYMRNAGSAELFTAVATGDQYTEGTGTLGGGYIGAGCYDVPSGSALVLLDRAPNVAGATATSTMYVGGTEVPPPSMWLDVAVSGGVTTGRGIPAWWASPPAC